MKPVVIRKLAIGEGMPKICAPIVGRSPEEMTEGARAVLESGADFAEWRVDWFADGLHPDRVCGALQKLRETLGELPLLFTFRTLGEGGEKAIEPDAYVRLNQAAAQSGAVDLIDVEAFLGEAVVEAVVDAAHAQGVHVIASNHEFRKTPCKEAIVQRLRAMQKSGADILKMAVMPKRADDVFTLLAATREMYETYADRPIITMSMADMGKISRLCGGLSGSAVTFGTAGRASAPGQIEVQKLAETLRLLWESEVMA